MAEQDRNIQAPRGEEEGEDDEEEEDDAESTANERMQLTADETRWAIAIKTAIEQTPDLDHLSDFMYAQYGIICKDNVQDAVERAEALQWCRQNYCFVESLNGGLQALRDLVSLQPGTHLSFGFDPASEMYTLAFDMSKIDTKRLRTIAMVNKFYMGNYYLFHCFCPDFESIRKGGVSIAECRDMDWTKKDALNGLKTVSSQIASVYPYTGQLKHYHTGSIFNVMLTILKKTFPKEERGRFHSGLTPECPSLDSLFLVPNLEVASERVVQALQSNLKRRFENEASFSLHHQDSNTSYGGLPS